MQNVPSFQDVASSGQSRWFVVLRDVAAWNLKV